MIERRMIERRMIERRMVRHGKLQRAGKNGLKLCGDANWEWRFRSIDALLNTLIDALLNASIDAAPRFCD